MSTVAAVADSWETSTLAVSPSIRSSSPARKTKDLLSRPKVFAPSRPAAKGLPKSLRSSPPVPSSDSASRSSRPGPAPLKQAAGEGNDSRRGGGGNQSAGGSDTFLLTAAERKKVEARDSKREAEQCFDFLVDIKDKDGRRPDHPDYDNRTVFIPQSAWASFSNFEKQFWEIKQNHFDTVLFFQKGKFYELYEDDAMIGHRDFDLKLTDRVKMKMVCA